MFLSDLRYENIYNLIEVLEEKLNMGEEITDDSINLIVNEIGELFDDTAKTVFGIRKSPVKRLRQSYDKSQQTPWFNGVCKDKREAFHYARKKYNVHKNDINRNRMNQASREYKKELNKAYDAFQNQMAGEIRSASKNNPKQFFGIFFVDVQTIRERTLMYR